MEVIGLIFYVVLALVMGGIGVDRRVGFWWPFLFSLFLTPIIGFVIAITSKRLSDIRHEKEVLNAIKGTPANMEATKAHLGQVATEIERLKALQDSGVLSPSEFEDLKRKAITGRV